MNVYMIHSVLYTYYTHVLCVMAEIIIDHHQMLKNGRLYKEIAFKNILMNADWTIKFIAYNYMHMTTSYFASLNARCFPPPGALGRVQECFALS
jgi:hypothetical protein